MATSRRKSLSCKFAGGCGQVFTSSSDLLEHVSQHLGEDYGDGNKGNGCGRLIFTGLDVSSEVSELHHPQLPLPTTPSRDLDLGFESMELFPELNVMMNKYHQLEEEAMSPNKAINMDQILQPLDPCLDLVSPAPLPVLDNVNWSELLENYPSAADTMDYQDIMDAHSVKKEDDRGEDTSFSSSFYEPSSVQSQRSAAEDADESNDEDERPNSTSGKDLGRIWMPVGQGKPLHFTASYLKHCGEMKYKQGSEDGRSQSGKQGFRQERVTFVTKEKRAYKAIVAIPRSKPKQINRRTNQHNNQEVKYYSSEFILREGLKKKRGITHSLNKPYICPVPGCGKAYKNPNGIKYHARYGHSAPQEFPCQCGKIYSTRHGLMAHKRTHSLSSSPGSIEDFYSYSEAEESDEYRNNTELI